MIVEYMKENGLTFETFTQCIVEPKLKVQFGIKDRHDYYKWAVWKRWGIQL
jgi:hypothetical protein